MTTDRPFLGILLMLGFCVLAPLGDSIAKWLGAFVSVGALVFVRFAAQAVLLAPLVVAWRLPLPLAPRLLRFVMLRTLLHIVGLGAMFASLLFLPLADALAIAFVMPFLLLLAAWLFMREEVGPHRLSACGVGFLGTLLVIQPNFAAVGWPALLPLIVAVAFAGFMLVTRHIAKEVDPIGMQALSGAMATVIIAPALVLFPGSAAFRLDGLGTASPMLLILLGVAGTVSHLLMTWSLRYAPSATLAPMQYLEIPVGAVLGWFVFRDLPDGLAAFGIALIIGAGLYIIVRERAISVRVTRPAPEQP